MNNILNERIYVTEEILTKLKSKTLYGKSYDVGDYINIVFVYTGMIGDSFTIETKTIVDSEIERFLSEHILYEENKYVPKFMIPEDEKPGIIL